MDATRGKTERLLSHPTFLRDLSRALVLGEGFSGPFTRSTWREAIQRSPGRAKAFRRWMRRRIVKPGSIPDAAGVDRQLVETVLDLEEPFGALLVRCFYSGVPLDATAEFYARPESWARSLLRRSLDRLRDRLDAQYGYDRGRWCLALMPLADLRDDGEPPVES